ncbi:MAG: hypothetical protein KDE27_17630 [Planctomycetes bacterium]|nr:hypothetical protein [Planctomycetota bacterium]
MLSDMSDGYGSDRAWIAAVAGGDDVASDRFCRAYLPFVRRRLRSRWRGSPLRALVPDAVQEVFVECLRAGGALAHFDGDKAPSLDAFVQGVASNVAARVERREARFGTRCCRCGDRILAFAMPGDAEPAERLAAEDAAVAVRAAVASLDADPAGPGHSLGELVRLHFRDGQPVREIAAAWRQPADRVHELRRGACARLRRRLRALAGATGLPRSRHC